MTGTPHRIYALNHSASKIPHAARLSGAPGKSSQRPCFTLTVTWTAACTPVSPRRTAVSSKIRCGLCFDPDFRNLSQLAEHLVGRRHVDLFPSRASTATCPYCGLNCDRNSLYRHIRSGDCPYGGQAMVPAAQIRRTSQAEFEADPLYTHVVEERIRSGLLRIRPMHAQHAFEAALAVTEAFTCDLDPPRFEWMLSELRRQACHYEARPLAVTRHTIDWHFSSTNFSATIDDVISEAPRAATGFPSATDGAERRDRQRREAESAWGVWVWLVADLIPDDSALLPPGQDSIIVGATAMMFHDRKVALEKVAALSPPISPAALDYSLWLRPYPPPELEHDRAVFVWWTSVMSAFQRQGVAGHLIRGCEAVGAAAGFWSFYIQAALRQRDRDNLLGAWLPREYGSALGAYRKAGYKEYRTEADASGLLWSPGRTAALMYKSF